MGSLSRFRSSFIISRSLLGCFASFSSGSISVAYRRSMLRQPSMVPPRKLRYNACSFIGTIVSQVRSYGECSRGLRAFAFLKVKSDPRLHNSSCFSVCLRMQGMLAEISLQHLKLNDYIYVSGLLGSYEKFNASGQPEIIYKVYVQDLNYVQPPDQSSAASAPAEPEARDASSSSPSVIIIGKLAEKQHLERLHLWQLFFASPNEWWDNRRSKRNPNFPDFKHRDTNECLWLSPNDPPWVREQLQLYDSCRLKMVCSRIL